jgi:hypothetical protein
MTFIDFIFVNHPKITYLPCLSTQAIVFLIYLCGICNTVFHLFQNSLHGAATPMAQDFILNRKSLFCILFYELEYNVNYLSGPGLYYFMSLSLFNTAVWLHHTGVCRTIMHGIPSQLFTIHIQCLFVQEEVTAIERQGSYLDQWLCAQHTQHSLLMSRPCSATIALIPKVIWIQQN